MTLEAKIIALASQDATLQALLGAGPTIGVNGFRWFDKQLPQGAINVGPCVRMLSVSESSMYSQQGLNPTRGVRMQIDAWAKTSAETARAVAQAIENWLETVDFSAGSSGVVSATHHPNLKLNQGGSMDYATQPPVHYERMDYRIFNLN
jgi:hypothetical protein